MTADVSRETSQPPAPLNDLIAARLGWRGAYDGRTLSQFREYDFGPEPGWPFGRKGLLLASIWEQLSKPGTPGMVINDGDCVLEPWDWSALAYSVATERDAVWTAPVRLYPAATNFPDWVWGHRRRLADGTPPDVCIKEWQQDISDPQMFTFNLTYLPRKLVEAAIKSEHNGGLKNWRYPRVDWSFWEIAETLEIPVRVVRYGCAPRHLHF
ncbi:MAG TPA: hypothetical protein VGG50_11600 [Streptosporangiaceae bacterium]